MHLHLPWSISFFRRLYKWIQLQYDEGCYPCIFLAFGRIPAMPPGVEHCGTTLIHYLNQNIGWELVVLGWGLQFQRLPFVFPIRMAITVQVRKPKRWLCQLLSVATMIMHSGPEERTTEGLWVGPAVSSTWPGLHLLLGPHI